jgi:hypothetical protein
VRFPGTQVWRSIPELADTPPAVAADLVRQAVRARHWTVGLCGMAGGVVGLCAGVAWGYAVGLVVGAIEAVPGVGAIPDGLVLAVVLAGAGLAVLWAAAVGAEWGTRDAYRSMVRAARCPVCGYSLLGLTAAYDWVRCPECALQLPVEGMGMTLSRVEGEAEPRTAPRYTPPEQ